MSEHAEVVGKSVLEAGSSFQIDAEQQEAGARNLNPNSGGRFRIITSDAEVYEAAAAKVRRLFGQ